MYHLGQPYDDKFSSMQDRPNPDSSPQGQPAPDNCLIEVDQEDWDKFNAMLDAPPKVLPEVQKLFSKPSVLESPVAVSGMTVEEVAKEISRLSYYPTGDAFRRKAGEIIQRERQQAVEDFAQKILHGDDGHKAWLLAAAKAYATGQPLPEIVNSDKLDKIITLELERDRLREALELFNPLKCAMPEQWARARRKALSQPPNTSGVMELLGAIASARASHNKNDLDGWEIGLVWRLFDALSPDLKQMIGGE